jgi:hypothetical protein
MSRWDWPSSARSFFEIDCDQCGCAASTLTQRQAFALMVERHSACRPTVVHVVRRKHVPKGKRSRWAIWLHNGE